MASRRSLKKEIYYITSTLITENYIRHQLFADYSNDKYRDVAMAIAQLNNEFLLRINHPEGTKDRKRTKAFFRALTKDFNVELDKVIDMMDESKEA